MALVLGLHYAEQLDPIVREELEQLVASIQAALNQQADLVNEISTAIQSGTLAAAPTGLGTGDAGFRYRVTDYGHELTWDGSTWTFSPGDVGNGFFRVFAVAPQEVGWALCDGSATTRLVLGSTLTAPAFTTPNPTDGTFLKRLAAYTGAVDAAVAPVMNTIGVLGASGDDMDIFFRGIAAAAFGVDANVADSSSKFTHRHTNDTSGVPKSLGGLLYFRR